MDRRGRIERILVGSPAQIVIPRLARSRIGGGRLRGLRLVHTHLDAAPLSTEDLTDLALLRLDLVAAIWRRSASAPAMIHIAHVNPTPGAKLAWTVINPERLGETEINFQEFIVGLEGDLSRQIGSPTRGETRKAVLIHLSALPKRLAQERLDELSELARTEMISTAESVIYRGAPHPKTFLGPGRVKELLIRAMAMGADMLLFDQELHPTQLKWISATADIPVLDRTQLILRIFARRAHSADGKLRVDLARLKYELPRVGIREEALSRIRGGVGMRGPGETTAKVTSRTIKDRIRNIEARLGKLGRGREERRKKRKRSGLPVAAIIGYTNAGKSALLNALTGGEALVEDKLFATLDPSTRRICYPRPMEVALSDTVGFIRDLPEDLLDAFRSTLEELRDADLLLHIVDVSAPGFTTAIETVESILRQLGLGQAPRRLVFNKIDLLDPQEAIHECARHGAIGVSALYGAGLAELSAYITREAPRLNAEKAAAPKEERPKFEGMEMEMEGEEEE